MVGQLPQSEKVIPFGSFGLCCLRVVLVHYINLVISPSFPKLLSLENLGSQPCLMRKLLDGLGYTIMFGKLDNFYCDYLLVYYPLLLLGHTCCPPRFHLVHHLFVYHLTSQSILHVFILFSSIFLAYQTPNSMNLTSYEACKKNIKNSYNAFCHYPTTFYRSFLLCSPESYYPIT